MSGKIFHGQAVRQLAREKIQTALHLPPPPLTDPAALRRARRLLLHDRLSDRLIARYYQLAAETQRQVLADPEIRQAALSDPTSAGPGPIALRQRLRSLLEEHGL
jgi:hypothetical protein